MRNLKTFICLTLCLCFVLQTNSYVNAAGIHKISAKYLINQGNYNDSKFYSNCGKTGATGTIKSNGCAICSLAMFILYKSNLSSSTNAYEAIVQATKMGTNENADFTASSFTATMVNKSIRVVINKTTDAAQDAIDGNICIIQIVDGKKMHWVLLDGFNTAASGYDRYLVSDPNGGNQITLTEAIKALGFSSRATINKKFRLS